MTLHSASKNLIKRLKCSDCGLPRAASLTAEWTPDGVIRNHLLLSVSPTSIIIEVEEYRGILESLQEAMGFNIDRIITEAERKAIKVWAWDLMEVVPPIIRRTKAASRLAFEVNMFMLCLAGLGDQETVKVEPSSHVIFFGKNLFHLPSAIGDRQGYCELVYGHPYSAMGIDMGGGRSLIGCIRSQEPSELEDRLELPPREIIPGRVEFDRCPKCRVPRDLTHYTWNWIDGTVTNSHSGLQEMMATSWTLEVLYSELTKELGEEIPRLIIEAERAFTVSRLNEFGLRLALSRISRTKGDPSEDIAALLAEFPFRGMGNPLEFSLENDELKLRVNNPFNEALVCGKVLGYYEALVGRKGKLEWTVPRGEWAIDVFITPG